MVDHRSVVDPNDERNPARSNNFDRSVIRSGCVKHYNYYCTIDKVCVVSLTSLAAANYAFRGAWSRRSTTQPVSGAFATRVDKFATQSRVKYLAWLIILGRGWRSRPGGCLFEIGGGGYCISMVVVAINKYRDISNRIKRFLSSFWRESRVASTSLSSHLLWKNYSIEVLEKRTIEWFLEHVGRNYISSYIKESRIGFHTDNQIIYRTTQSQFEIVIFRNSGTVFRKSSNPNFKLENQFCKNSSALEFPIRRKKKREKRQAREEDRWEKKRGILPPSRKYYSVRSGRISAFEGEKQ